MRFWDPRTGARRGVIDTHDFVGVLAYSPDGRTLATAGTAVHLWNTKTRAPLGSFGHFKDYVNGLAFSPDAKTLAVASASSDVGLWDVASHKRRGRLRGHRGPVFDVAYSRGARTLATAGSDKTLRLWDPVTSAPRGRLPIAESASDIALSRDGELLVTRSNEDDELRLFDLTARRELALRGDNETLTFALSPDDRTIAAADFDGTVHLWSTVRRRVEGQLRSSATGQVMALAFSPDGKTLAGGALLPVVVLWDPAAPGFAKPFGVATPPFALSRDGTLAAAGRAGTVRLLDPATRAVRGRLGGHGEQLTALAFSPDGTTLATGGLNRRQLARERYNGAVRLLDRRSGAQVAVLERRWSAYGLAFSPDGRMLAAPGYDGAVRLFDTARRVALGKLGQSTDPIVAVAFSPDGATLATASANHVVRLWDPKTRKQKTSFIFGRDTLGDIAFSPHGALLAVSSSDGSVLLWSTERRTIVGRLNGTAKSVYGIAFSRDGATLATASSDGTARLWDVATRKQRGRIAARDGEVVDVGFAPDGRTLVTATRKRLHLWHDALWAGVAELRAVVCRQLRVWPTRAEWAQYASGISYRKSCP